MVAAHIASARASFALTIDSLASFLRHPRPEHRPYATTKSKMIAAFWLFVLSMLAAAAFGVLALPFLLTSDTAPGDNLGNVFDRPFLAVVVTVILLGPVFEEVLFRGWLSGARPALLGTAVFLPIVYGGGHLAAGHTNIPALPRQVALTVIGLATAWGLASMVAPVVIKGYDRLFPLLFWAQGLAFGLLHLRNVAADSLIIPLLATLPFFICGWLWGYARIALGLPAAIALHVAYNVPATFGTMLLIATRPAGGA